MKTKFTKGEWVSLGYRVDVDIADGLSGICEMSNWMSVEEMNANAKLIAAAPEMLKMIVALSNQLKGHDLTLSDDFTLTDAEKLIEKITV